MLTNNDTTNNTKKNHTMYSKKNIIKLKELYYKYCVELNQYSDDSIPTKSETDSFLMDFLDKSYYDINEITEDGTDKLIGFLITSVSPQCHPLADYFIAESYVLPEYRKKGYMTRTVTKLVIDKKGIWSLLVLKKNIIAKSFWNKLFKEKLNYVDAKLPKVPLYPEEFNELVYQLSYMTK